MNKRKILLIAVIVSLVASTLLCGTVFAYMFKITGAFDNEFTPASVSCKVNEVFDGENKTSVTIQNTGNIDAYLRVRFVSYWVDAEGNIVSKKSEMPEISLAEGWIAGSNDTYYYQTPVAPDAKTGELLSAQISLKEEDGYRQVIEVFAEGIQSEPKKAVVNSWSVTVDSDGKITDAP